MKKILSLLTLVVFMKGLNAQQDLQYSLYPFNQLYINPAYTGSREAVSLMGIYRHQWVDIEGAPRGATFSVHSPLKNDKVALGAHYTYDKLGVETKNALFGTFAYRIPLKTSKLSFGLQAGATYYQYNAADVQASLSSNDPTFTGYHNTAPNVGAGVYWYAEKHYLGFSVPHMLNVNLTENFHNASGSAYNEARQSVHYLLSGGYVFDLAERVKFKPSFLGKYVKNAPLSLDLTGGFHFLDKELTDRVYLGGTYRINSNWAALAYIGITKGLRLGYAYDGSTTQLKSYNKGTHEIMLGYDFGKKASCRVVNPRYIRYF